jgi:hypothetical protein
MAKPGRPRGLPRTGGRQKGTPNKRTQDLRERLAAVMGEDWCAVTSMAQMSNDPELRPEVRARLLAEVASYQVPKPKPQTFDVDEAVNLAEKLECARRRAMVANGGMTLAELVQLSFATEAPIATT